MNGAARLGTIVFATVIFAAGAAAAQRAAGPADLVVSNGKVFTADVRGSVVQAFAVKDGRFIAVGPNEAVRGYIGPATQAIDLHGRFVVPGLADGHFHNEGGGPGVDLSRARSMADLLAAVAAAAKKSQPGEVIVSNNDWHEAQLAEKRLPTAALLDTVAPDNPVVLVRGGHEMILNTAALRKWGIGRDTASPAGGEIGKGADGEPNGELVDNAKSLVTLPPPPPITIDDVLATQKTLNAYGITAVRVPGRYKGDLFADYKLLKEAHDSDRLTLRYIVYLPGFGTRDPERIRAMIVNSHLKQDEGDDWLRIGGMKLLVDGGFEGGHMSRPYEEPYGKGGRFSGIAVVPPSAFTAVVKQVNALGWRVATHAVGDAAVDEVLDAYEAANAEHSIIGKRWTIEHAFVTRPEQIARMRKLKLMLSVQDHLYLAAPVLKQYWGAARAAEVTPVRTYLKAGFLVVGGTDSPVIPFNPFWQMYHFNTRDTISDGVYGADQRVASRATLVKMNTINYARMIGEARIKGSIEPGKLADFAVLTDDLLAAPAKSLLKTRALATYVGGKEVYRDSSFR